MKSRYEHRTRYYLPRRTYTVIRVDGKNFHRYTRDLTKPFDDELLVDLTLACVDLCDYAQGARLGYVQSDEISLILTDFTTPQTDAWFDGNVQKLASVAASRVTAYFNRRRDGELATFDARVFTIPEPIEVHNYLVWRQHDAVRNSISMAARAYASHGECVGKSSAELQELLFTRHNVNWNDYDPRFKRGVVVYPETMIYNAEWIDGEGARCVDENVERRVWRFNATPIFTSTPTFVGHYVSHPTRLPIGNDDEASDHPIHAPTSQGRTTDADHYDSPSTRETHPRT